MILLIGPTGSGKSTQGQILAKKYGFVWISAGQLLKAHLTPEMKRAFNLGNLVATDVVTRLIDEALGQLTPGQQVIIDGFPRTLKQLEEFDKLLFKHGQRLDSVIYLKVPEAETYRRLENRGRADDPAVANKLQIFQKQTIPVVKEFSRKKLVQEVDGLGELDLITRRIEQALKA